MLALNLTCDRHSAATIFATKGQPEKGLIYMGKGFAGRKLSRKSHITVALREARDAKRFEAAAASAVYGPIGRGRRAPGGVDFRARVVAPIMTVGRGAEAAVQMGKSRVRFAYKTEV